MVARALNLGGVDLGPASDLIPPSPDNPEGFWENRHFVAVDEVILAAFGGRWDRPPALPPAWACRPELAPLYERAHALFAAFDPGAPWAWKDPRSSLTLPFWRRLVPDLRVVVCLRNPLEVVGSLRGRLAVPAAARLDLWLAYHRRLLEDSAPGERLVTHWAAWFHDAPAELRRVLGLLGLSASDDVVARGAASVRPALRHHRATTADLRAGASPEVVRRYLDLCEEAGPVYRATILARAAG